MSKEAEFCKIIADRKNVIADWVCRGLDMDPAEIGENITLGFMAGGKPLGGLIYHNYRPNTDVWWTIYTINKRWCSRRVLRCIFDLAFERLSCRRINILVSKDNADCLRLVKKLGFQSEGLLRQYRTNGEDVYVLGMLKSECKWRK